MNFSLTPARLLRGLAITAAAGVLALMAACGGGTQLEPFVPVRVLSFGDEWSVLVPPEGRKYGLNNLTTTGAIDCTTYPIWNQYLASNFGLPFDACKGTSTSAPSRSLATVGAKAADVKTQVDNFLAAGGAFSGKDLVTVLAGLNDVLELNAAVEAGSTNLSTAIAAVKDRGAVLGNQVNRMATAGAKVVVLTLPDVSLTPFAQVSGAPSSRATVLSQLSSSFNSSLRQALINDGHMIGLAFGDTEFLNMSRFPTSYSLTDVKTPLCKTSDTASLPNECTTDPAKTIATTPSAYLWAGLTAPGIMGHQRLGEIAVTRARNNPF
ncbi:MAG TPA: SGNH/GDSL hydrolase family protein [Burkholderiaceae bacterium]|nr:SGNH/GDSL hydrolase family protein [Burkholderiaceae bacterium]